MKKGAIISRPLLALVASVSVGWALAAGAQPAVQQPEPLPPSDLFFGEEIDVRVVNLEVVVEDRAGNRVEGLSADDFRILVDGEEVGVDYFTEILENRAVETAEGEAPPAIGDGELVPTNYVLFVDDDHTNAFRRPVLRGVADRLDGLHLQDQVAVVVQSQSRIEMLSAFTTNRKQTREAIQELIAGRKYGGVMRSRRVRFGFGTGSTAGVPVLPAADVLRDGPASSEPGTPGNDQGEAGSLGGGALVGERSVLDSRNTLEEEARAEMLARELEFSVAAVVSTMRALDPPEGRKVLMLVAGAWPTGNFRIENQSIGLRTDREILSPLVDTANLLGYTIYPVDQLSNQPNMDLWQNLRYMARGTGGRAFMAGTNLAALKNVSEDTANYYWLGFAPEYLHNDQVHDIRVEALRPGLQVRSRRGYVDLSRRAEADMEAQGALLFPDPGEPPESLLRVEIGAIGRIRARKMTVPVKIHVPVGHFPALPYQDHFLMRLELRFATVDQNGQQADIPVIPITLRTAQAPPPEAVVPYETVVTMRRKPHDLVVSVRDPLSRLTVSTRTSVKP